MDTTSSDSLNLAIQRWREGLASSPALQRENIDELESHLHDSMSELQSCGLSAEEAFMVATRRVGHGDSLAAEFGKINVGAVWLDRLLWVLIAVQVWGVALSVISSIANYALMFALKYAGVATATGVPGVKDVFGFPTLLFALTRVTVLVATAAFCWWLIVRHGSAIAVRFKALLARRAMLAVTCAALCLVTMVGYGIPGILTTLVAIDANRAMVPYWIFSQVWTSSFQVVTLIVATLVIAKKRWRLSAS